ncbi:uncharacterized protein [Neodiprion pinetum]|uniref:uncharacterized protein n=1 Tax=Neodiprion pinetum TaxID=441929 RepID=UPI001EE070A1|nr:uncharacterized protein LOC124214713 [Neodiprion pinetum]
MKSLLILQCLVGLRVVSGLQDETITMPDDDSNEEFIEALSDSSTQQKSSQSEHVNDKDVSHGTVQEDSGKKEVTTIHESDKTASHDEHNAKNGPHEKLVVIILGEEILLPVEEHAKDVHAEPVIPLEEYIEAIQDFYTNPIGEGSGTSHFTEAPEVIKNSSTLPAKQGTDNKAEAVEKKNSTSEKSKLSESGPMIAENDKVSQNGTASSTKNDTQAPADHSSSKNNESVKDDHNKSESSSQIEVLTVIPLGSDGDDDTGDDSFAEDFKLYEDGAVSSLELLTEDHADLDVWPSDSLSSFEEYYNFDT